MLIVDEFAAFVPLSIAPVRAKAEGFDSATSLKRKITLHLSNLYEAKWGGTGMERDSGFSLVPRVIEPIYGFNSTIPLGMRFAKEYPDEWEGFHGWEYPHGNASLYGGFKGIVKFVFDNYTLWDDFRFLMHKSDSGYWTGGTTLSWLAELDFDNAVVEKDWDVRRWDAIQASKSGQ